MRWPMRYGLGYRVTQIYAAGGSPGLRMHYDRLNLRLPAPQTPTISEIYRNVAIQLHHFERWQIRRHSASAPTLASNQTTDCVRRIISRPLCHAGLVKNDAMQNADNVRRRLAYINQTAASYAVNSQ